MDKLLNRFPTRFHSIVVVQKYTPIVVLVYYSRQYVHIYLRTK